MFINLNFSYFLALCLEQLAVFRIVKVSEKMQKQMEKLSDFLYFPKEWIRLCLKKYGYGVVSLLYSYTKCYRKPAAQLMSNTTATALKSPGPNKQIAENEFCRSYQQMT